MKKLWIYLLLCCCARTYAQGQFTNSGNFSIHVGTSMSLFGNYANNGTLTDSGTVITLAGTSAQTLSGSSVTNFKNLTLNNTAGASLLADQNISGVLTVSSGVLTTTGHNFTLLSNATGTARIAPILGDITGNITMQRYINTGGVADWRFLAAPVTGAAISDWQDDFITTGFPGSTYPGSSFVSVYTYSESAAGPSGNGYNVPAGAADALTPGNGYWCYMGPGTFTVDVTGPPAKFNQSFPVAYTPSAGAANDGWMMIGNPYPSPIDWSSAAWTKHNINSAIYIWNPALQQYASWVSGVTTNGGSSIIASSQSFWVQSNGASPSLSCTENVKSSTNQAFLKPQNQVFDYLKLSLSGNGYGDEAYVRFGAGATNDFDTELDARKVYSSNPAVPSLGSQDSTQTDMAVNSLPAISSALSIPVKTLVGAAGSYTISSDSTSPFPAGLCIVLEDLATGIRTNLSTSHSYAFSISDTTVAARFLLHVTPGSSHTAQVAASCHGTQDGMAIAKGMGTGPWDYTWLDGSGHTLQSTLSPGADTLRHIPAGAYQVQVSDPNSLCGAVSNTVLVSEPGILIADFTLSADSIYAGQSDSIRIMNTSSGALHHAWGFGDGTTDTLQYPQAHLYHAPGHYTITLVISNNGCRDSITKRVTVKDPLATALGESGGATGISVYPNPGKGLFYIAQQRKDADAYVEVYTSAGDHVFRQAVSQEKTELDMRQMAPGIYFYRLVFTDKRVYTGKLVME